MPPASRLKGVACAVLTLAIVGCSTTRPPRPLKPTEPLSPPPAALTPPPPGPILETKPPLPPASLGPRAAPEAPEAAAPAPVPPPVAESLPHAAPPIAPPVPPGQRGRFVVLNFDNADVETVVHAASEILGFNYVMAPDVRGKVTVQTSGRIAQEEIFNLLLAVLEVHGFTAVKSGTLYKIVRIPEAATRAVPTVIGAIPQPARDPDEVITQIVPVRYANVNELKALLQPLVSPQRGSLIAHRDTNVLIITDTGSNIRRLLDIVRVVDVEVGLEEVQVIPLQYADAGELAQILNQLFVSGRLRAAPAGGAPPAPAPTPGAPAVRGAAEGAAERPPLILAERRSNALVVNARRNEIETIKNLVKRLDVNITGGRRIFIYYAENAKAKELAATMNAIYGKERAAPPPTGPAAPPPPGAEMPPPPAAPPTIYGPGGRPGSPEPGTAEAGLVEGQFRFIADETTNAVVVATYPRYWADFEHTLKQLDRSPRQVLIEVLVAEITLTEDTKLGVEWAVRTGRFDLSNAPGLGTNAPGTLQARPSFPLPPASPITTLGGFNFFTFETRRFFTALNAFASENRANILSSPSILTSENKKAVINVSNSIPVVTSQQVPIGGAVPAGGTVGSQPAVVGTQSVQYVDAGVILTVTPRIGERGTVALDVKQEVNDIGDPEPPTQSRRIIKREAETSVVLLNNQTLVVGGLIRDKRSNTGQGVPWLRKIPILGFLFGSRTVAVEKTELLILITPRVIGTALDAARILDTMRKSHPQIDESLKQAVPLPPTTAPAAPTPPAAPAPPAAPPPAAPAAPETVPPPAR